MMMKGFNGGSLEKPANRTAKLNGTNRPIKQYSHRNITFSGGGTSSMKMK